MYNYKKPSKTAVERIGPDTIHINYWHQEDVARFQKENRKFRPYYIHQDVKAANELIFKLSQVVWPELYHNLNNGKIQKMMSLWKENPSGQKSREYTFFSCQMCGDKEPKMIHHITHDRKDMPMEHICTNCKKFRVQKQVFEHEP